MEYWNWKRVWKHIKSVLLFWKEGTSALQRSSSWCRAPGWWMLELVLDLGCLEFPDGSDGKESVYSAGDQVQMATHSSILALENSRDWGAWQAIVHGIAKTQIQLSDWYFLGYLPPHPALSPQYPPTTQWNRIWSQKETVLIICFEIWVLLILCWCD